MTGVVGASSNDVSKELAEILGPMGVTQVSHASTDPELSDREKYPTFLRTVPSDSDQVQVLLDVLKEYNWTYVKVVYSSNAYGQSLATHFISMATEIGICIATQVKLEDHLVKDKVAMVNLVDAYLLQSFPEARVVVMLTTDVHARAVLQAVDSLATNLSPWQQNLTWVATDHWGSLQSVVKGLEHIAKNAITLDFEVPPIPDFMSHFANLTPDGSHTLHNPWFKEFWQQHFDCHLHSHYTPLYPTPCSPTLSLINEHLPMSSSVPFAVDAVTSLLFGVHWLVHDQCGYNHTGLCAHARRKLDRLHGYVKDVTFVGNVTRRDVRFDVLGSGRSDYSVLRFAETAPRVYRYGKVSVTFYGKCQRDILQSCSILVTPQTHDPIWFCPRDP